MYTGKEETLKVSYIDQVYGDSIIASILCTSMVIKTLGLSAVERSLRPGDNTESDVILATLNHAKKLSASTQSKIIFAREQLIFSEEYTELDVFYAYTDLLRSQAASIVQPNKRMERFVQIDKLENLSTITSGDPLIFFSRESIKPHPAFARCVPGFEYTYTNDSLFGCVVSLPIFYKNFQPDVILSEETATRILFGSSAINSYLATDPRLSEDDLTNMREVFSHYSASDEYNVITGPIHI